MNLVERQWQQFIPFSRPSHDFSSSVSVVAHSARSQPLETPALRGGPGKTGWIRLWDQHTLAQLQNNHKREINKINRSIESFCMLT